MRLDPRDGEILGFQITAGFGSVAHRLGGGGGLFVGLEQMGDKIFRGGRGHAELGDFREFGQWGQAAGSEDVEGAEALGDFIDGGKQLFVLRLEGRVELEEGRPLDVPMGQVGLGHQGVTVREQGLEGRDDGSGSGVGGGGFGGGAHGGILFGMIPN